jgi:cytochrome P450
MTATVIRAGIARRKNGDPPPDVSLADIDLGALEFWEWDDDLRDGAFATLRRESPIAFFEVPEIAGFAAGSGHWALTTFDDIHHASRHPEIFSSIPTSTALNEVPAEIAEFVGSMISVDDPRHLRLRKIVNRAFTPRVVARIEDSVRDRAHRIVANMIAQHRDAEADFVAEVSGLLPLQIICDMMGIPEEDELKVFHWTTVILGVGDDEVSGEFDEVITAVTELAEYGVRLAEERRVRPGDDLATNGSSRGRRRAPHIGRDRVFFILLGRRQRDDTQCHQSRHGGTYPLSRGEAQVVVRLRRGGRHRRRGDRPMGFADYLHAAQPH